MMKGFLDRVRERVRGAGARIVLADGSDPRARDAAAALAAEELARPILLGAGAAPAGVEMRDPATDPRAAVYAGVLHDLRRKTGLTAGEAAVRAREPHWYGALAVRQGDADGLVSGLASETKPFIPAFSAVGLAPGITRASSYFLMVWPDRVLLYADCGVNIAPDTSTLAAIGRATAATARALGLEPKVAFLSFSTRGSAEHESVDRMREAAAMVRAAEPGLPVDGELQFDAAFVPEVARRKCPDSPLAGAANVFIFPDLNSGNIAYKITERLGGAQALGPLLQGLAQPVHDLSRGASVQDIVDVATIAALGAVSRA